MTEAQIEQLFAVDTGPLRVSREFQMDDYLLSVHMAQWGGVNPAATATYWEIQMWTDADGNPKSRSRGMGGTAEDVARHYAKRCQNAEKYLALCEELEYNLEVDRGETYDGTRAWMY